MNKWSKEKWKKFFKKLLWMFLWLLLIEGFVKLAEVSGMSTREINGWLIAFLSVEVGSNTWRKERASKWQAMVSSW